MFKKIQFISAKLFAILFFILVTQTSWSESFIYFQNNSSLEFSVNSFQTGSHTMDNDEWWGMSNGTIKPWQLQTNVLWTNRESGIHNGTDFFLTTTLTHNGESIHLKIKLNGNFIGSNIWTSTEGPGFNAPWFDDRNFHEQIFTLAGKTFTIKYASYSAGTYDDTLFVIQEHNPFTTNSNDLTDLNKLNILSYNIYMISRPVALTDQSTRATYIAENVVGYDVIIINEAFDNTARNILTANLSAEYPYFTDVVDESGAVEDGGVLIYSRWPIEYSEDIVYSDCDAEDCFAAKGAMYAKINKLGKVYHIFGTHLQAWAEPFNVSTRQAQMAQLKAFVNSKNIPATEPIIYGGDFNVEKFANYLNEYDAMFSILNAEQPTYVGHLYSYDYELSSYASDTKEHLDYLMYEKSHQIPYVNTNRNIVLRSISDGMWDISDLSDHLAVQGYFEFDAALNVFEETKFTPKIYPNPVKDILNITNKSNYPISKITIVDALGNTISEFNYTNLKSSFKINVSNLSKGVYFINISSGRFTSVKKLIKN